MQGKVVGGGVGIVSASDYALATKAASFRLSEIALGIGLYIGPAVERKIGVAAFNQLSIDADWYSAEWAQQHGLYAKVFDSISELDGAVSNFVLQLTAYSSDAMRELKKVSLGRNRKLG